VSMGRTILTPEREVWYACAYMCRRGERDAMKMRYAMQEVQDELVPLPFGEAVVAA
jgi:hypothetical protein